MTAVNKYNSATGYLQRKMKELHDEIGAKTHAIKNHLLAIAENENRIAILKVHYTSLLNTALAYEDFDKEDFESGL